MAPIKKTNSYSKHYHPEENSGICVVKREGESADNLIRRFRRKFSKSGMVKELRDRMFYEKPSDKKRRKKMQCIRNIEREQEKIQEMQERYERIKRKKRKIQSKARRKENQYDSSNSR